MQSLMQTPPHRPAAPAAEVGTTGPTPTVAEVAQQEEEEEQQAVQQEKVQEEAARAQGGRLLSGLRLPPPLRVPVSREEEGEEEQKEQKQGGLDPEGVAVALLAMQAPDEADIVMASAAAGEVLTLGLWAWALGAVVLASYWRTLPPGLGSGDGTGDLVATACQLSGGSQHPQLTLLLTALALRLIPASWGSDARRSNLISAACCTTLATMLLFLCVHKLGGASARRNGFRPLAVAVPAALLFAWCPRAWAHAIKADGVAVDALIFAGALYAALQCASTWNVRARRMWTRVAVGCAGLALCNQPSTAAASLAAVLLMYGPILVCLVWGLTADLPLFHVLVDLGGVFMLSLLPCAVLPLVALLASSADELLAVGLFETGGRSGTTFPWSWPLTVDRLMAFAWDLKTGQGLYGLVPLLAVVGAAAYGGRGVGRFLLPPRYTGEAAKVVAARNRHIREALGHLPGVRGRRIREEVDQREHEARQSSARVGWGILGASILSLFLPPDTDHTVTTHLLGCLLAGLGLDWMLQLLMIATTYGPMWRRGLGYVGACTLCVGLPLLQLLLTQRGVLAGTGMPAAATGIDMWRGYARSLLEPLPRGAALFVTNRMQSSPLRYHHVCEGLRRDVKIVPLSQIAERQCLSPVGPAVASGTGGVTWPGDMSMWRLLDAFMDRAPGGVFLAGCILNDEAAGYHDTFMTVPFGLTMRFVRQDAPAAEQQWYDRNRNAWRLILHQVGTS